MHSEITAKCHVGYGKAMVCACTQKNLRLRTATIFLVHRKNSRRDHKGACLTEWDRDDGLSLGKFIFVPKGEKEPLIAHEYGHTLQSLILGPAYLLLVGAPSFVWMRIPFFARKRKKTGKSYYSPVFEKTANRLGKTDLR